MAKQVDREWWVWSPDGRDGPPNHGWRGWEVVGKYPLPVDYRYRVAMHDLQRRKARGEMLASEVVADFFSIPRDRFGLVGTWRADMVVWELGSVHGIPRWLTPPMFNVATVLTMPQRYPRRIWLQPDLYHLGKIGLCFTNKDDHYGDHTIEWHDIDRQTLRNGPIDWRPVFGEVEVAIDAFYETGEADPRFL